MKKNNSFLTIICFCIFLGCGVKAPQISKEAATNSNQYPKYKELDKRFFLVGDPGNNVAGVKAPGIKAFQFFLDSVQNEGDYVIFLGDNIYPNGMPPEGHKRRREAELRMASTLETVNDFKGTVMFIPGNHDWYVNGIEGLEDQKEFIENNIDGDFVWAPEIGTGLEIMDVGDDVTLMTIDTQWYLANWDKHPLVNDDADEIKTREEFFLEVESEFKKSQNKTMIVATHHPLYTNGLHGGQYSFRNHVYPTQRGIPMPILGSLSMLIRTSGGVSIQDAQNEQYKSLVNRLTALAHGYDNIIFVSGHEHSLQYIENEHVKQIVSGSASKSSYVNLGMNGLFAYNGQGFAVYDVFKDGSSWVRFFGTEGEKPKLIFEKEVIEKEKELDVSELPTEFSKTVKASIYNPKDTEKSDFYESVWGDRYRELYGTKIEAKVAVLDTLYGGLTPMRKGGGHQTKSIRLKDTLNREYNLRAIKKSAVQFLQTVAYKNKPVAEQFENTLAENIIYDFYTSAHPYGFMAIPTLADAAGIYHTNPEIFYVPKQPALGKYNKEYGGELYMLEERPEENWMGTPGIFGNPNHDIQSTDGLYDRLRRDEKYKFDEDAYIRARLFDMLVGDWDRHHDQWRWHEEEREDGNRVFEPIPRDRDQVFSNFDGALLGTLKGLLGAANQFVTYSEDIDDVKWFNKAALGMDRSLIQNKGRESWLAEAKYLQEHITDDVIEEAFSHLPKETLNESTETIKEKLRGRRENLVSIANRYYDYLSELAIITATDKDDYIEVERLNDGKTRVVIRRIKGGEKGEYVSDKTYSSDVTKEIWIYGLDDDDVFEVTGEADDLIKVRIIGGQNNDIYKIESGEKVKIYDHESKPNTIEKRGDAMFRFTDQYNINVYDKNKNITSNTAIIPAVGYNPDDGFKLGLQGAYTLNGFKRNPFTAQHNLRIGYYFATKGYDLEYSSEFANIIGRYNFTIGANYTSPNFARNFFGYGNESGNFDDELGRDFNRTKISRIGVNAGFLRESDYGSFFSYIASFEGIEVERTEGRFVDEIFGDADSGFFDRKYFAGLEGTFRYESYDNVLNPTNGLYFKISAGGKMDVNKTETTFGYIDPRFEMYNSLTRNRKWVLRSHLNGQFNIGDDYQFYQAAELGGNSGLRGYRLQRFIGKTAFAAGGDLRYSFEQFRTSFLPFQIGVFGGYDIGRVWAQNEDSDIWHDSYGGGIWVNSASAMNGTFSLFGSEEGLRFSFGFGFQF